jgi:magnesium transporter
MDDVSDQLESWEQVKALIASGDAGNLESFLDGLPVGERALALDRLDDQEQDALLALLGAEHASDLIADLSLVQAVDVLEHMDAQQAADIVDELPFDTQADLLQELEDDQAEAILDVMPTEDAKQVRALLAYDDDVAGGLMHIELLRFKETQNVQEVVDNMRAHAEDYSDLDVQYGYVIDNQERLVGVLRLRDLLLAPLDRALSELMLRDPVSVDHLCSLHEMRALFDERMYLGLPVVDEDLRLCGVVLRDTVMEATSDEATEDFLKVSGLQGREEIRSMPLQLRSRRRLSWLSINIVLNVIAASVIAFFHETLVQVIALAVFLPIISDMSGCSGNQSVAVSIRELTLGLVRPRDIMRVLVKEAAVGLVNGLVLGLLIASVAWLWQGNPWLGLVVGVALMLNTLLAVCLGGSIPLVLKRFNMDPALASGPILTTVTDMCGFFFVLGLATLMLHHLV